MYFRIRATPGLVCCFALCGALGGITSAVAQGFSLGAVGARVGGSPTGNGHNFHEADAFLNFDLPWSWTWGRDWELKMRLDYSAGWLADPGGNGFITTVEPAFELGRKDLPVVVEGGAGPTVLSRYQFQEKNFGDYFQFTSHIGFGIELPAHLRVGYRFQHMSNSGISGHNPGLNLHMFELSYRF